MGTAFICNFYNSQTNSNYKQITDDLLCARKTSFGSEKYWYYEASYDIFQYTKIVAFSISTDQIPITYNGGGSANYPVDDRVTAELSINGLPNEYFDTILFSEYNPVSYIQLSRSQTSNAVLTVSEISFKLSTNYLKKFSSSDFRDMGSCDYYTTPESIVLHISATFI